MSQFVYILATRFQRPGPCFRVAATRLSDIRVSHELNMASLNRSTYGIVSEWIIIYYFCRNDPKAIFTASSSLLFPIPLASMNFSIYSMVILSPRLCGLAARLNWWELWLMSSCDTTALLQTWLYCSMSYSGYLPPYSIYDLPWRQTLIILVQSCCWTLKTWAQPLEFYCIHIYQLRYA